jgi:hypothetical protein
MLFAATLAASMFGLGESKFLNIQPFESDKVYFQGTSLVQCMIAAFLIGLGTRLAHDHLSKFAFYGLPAYNWPSIYCALFTVFVAVITATFRSSLPLFQGLNLTKKFAEVFDFRLPFLIPFAMLIISIARNYTNSRNLREIFFSFGIGSLLATGMMLGGLTKRHMVLDFLSLNKHWNPSLAFFFVGAWLCHTFMWKMLPTMGVPPSSGMPASSEIPPSSGIPASSGMPLGSGMPASSGIPSSIGTTTSTQVLPRSIPGLMSPKTLLGCILFGIGKGMTGLSLGSALLVSPIYFPHATLFVLPSILGGQLLGGMFDKWTKGTKGTKEL